MMEWLIMRFEEKCIESSGVMVDNICFIPKEV